LRRKSRAAGKHESRERRQVRVQSIDLAFLLAELLKKERVGQAKPLPAAAGL